jgi:hypothetical protein
MQALERISAQAYDPSDVLRLVRRNVALPAGPASIAMRSPRCVTRSVPCRGCTAGYAVQWTHLPWVKREQPRCETCNSHLARSASSAVFVSVGLASNGRAQLRPGPGGLDPGVPAGDSRPRRSLRSQQIVDAHVLGGHGAHRAPRVPVHRRQTAPRKSEGYRGLVAGRTPGRDSSDRPRQARHSHAVHAGNLPSRIHSASAQTVASQSTRASNDPKPRAQQRRQRRRPRQARPII